jgi:hypothetical protein
MPYTITKVVGENDFELSIPHFLFLHPVFNVEQLRPYFPPLLDTLEVEEHLAPTKLNPNCIEPTIVYWIIDTKTKNMLQQSIQLYRVVKAGKFLHQGKWLTRSKIRQKFPHMMEELDAMENIAF